MEDMEDKYNTHRINQHNKDEEPLSLHFPSQVSAQASTQVPATLFPTVLRRLGLTSEQTSTEQSFDDIAANLQSDDWEVRIAAVRSLGEQHSALSKQLLLSALNDEDGSVRAAAIRALGSGGPGIPLHPLMAALHDNDWHVRETAVFALGKQGKRVPQKVFMSVLSDADEAVREAARIVLQQHALEEKTSDSFGLLWEQPIMKDEKEVISLSNGIGKQHTSKGVESIPHYGIPDTGSYHENSSDTMERPRFGAEQEQMHVPREQGNEKSARWEKVTSFSPRRGLGKGWWAVTAAVAVVCFLLGSVTMSVLPSPVQIMKGFAGGKHISVSASGSNLSIFTDPQYAFIAQDDIASGLHMNVGQVQTRLSEGRSLTDMANAQGISATSMQNIEMKALTHLLNAAVTSGDIQQQDADELIKQLQSNPPLLEKMAISVFETAPVGPVSTSASGS